MPCPEKFKESLNMFKINESIQQEINVGYEELVSSSPKPDKAEYFRRAMTILDKKVSADVITQMMDYNGCCKSGARQKASVAFAKANKDKTLAEKVPLISEVRNMGKPTLISEDLLSILAVQYYDGVRYRCACPNFNSSIKYLDTSKTYCKCCSGHFRYHYQIMLGVKLELVEVTSSPLGSDGKDPCVFLYKIIS